MKASELKQIIEDLMLRYGDLDIIFKDKDLNANFNIHANIVRVSRTENGRYVYGCHFSEEQQSVEKYIQKKQLHELQSQRAQSK